MYTDYAEFKKFTARYFKFPWQFGVAELKANVAAVRLFGASIWFHIRDVVSVLEMTSWRREAAPLSGSDGQVQDLMSWWEKWLARICMPTFLVRRSRPHDKRFVDNYSSFEIFNEASSTIAGTFFGLTLMASKLQTPGDKEKSYCLLRAMLQAMGEDSFILPLMLHEHAGLNLAVARTTDANVVALTWSSGYVDIRPLLEGNLAQSLPGFAGLKERLLCLDPARVHVGTLLTEAFRTKAFWMLRQLLLGVEWVLERRLANEKAGYMVTSALQCLKAVPGKKRRDVDVTFELLSKRMKKSATGEANRWDAAHYAFHAALQAGSSLADGGNSS